MRPLRIVQVGLGPIGRAVVRAAVACPDTEVVATVDTRPRVVGLSAADVLGIGDVPGRVTDDLAAALAWHHPDVAIVATVSDPAANTETCAQALGMGVNVVTTCEELAHPRRTRPALARTLADAAKQGPATMLATGVNPGFVLDVLPITACAPVSLLHTVRVRRVVDVATRRPPLQAKVGMGLDPAEAEARRARGELGHRGLLESLLLLCDALGVDGEDARDEIEVVVAEDDVRSGDVLVPAGRVLGIHQTASDRSGRVSLDLWMVAGAPSPEDRVDVEGDPCMRLVIQGGTPGEAGTCGAVLAGARYVATAPPGLHTALDVVGIRGGGLAPR